MGLTIAKLVPEASASYDGTRVANIGLNVNHYDLNKSLSADTEMFRAVGDEICHLLQPIAISYRPSIRHLVPSFLKVHRFVERVALQARLETILGTPHADLGLAKAACVTGFGGAGKTQLVLKYIEEHSNEYETIIWIDARTRDSLLSSFRSCAIALGIKLDELSSKRSPELIHQSEVYKLLDWLEIRVTPGQEWLVVLDNIEDLQMNLRQVIPRGVMGTVIITSQNNASYELLCPHRRLLQVPVDEMETSEAVSLLLGGIGSPNSTSDECANSQSTWAKEVVMELDNFALAVDLAAAYIRRHEEIGIEPAMRGYLAALRSRRKEIMQRNDFAGFGLYEKTLWTVWETSLQAVERTEFGSMAIKLLKFLALFDFAIVEDDFFERASIGLAELAALNPSSSFDSEMPFCLPDWLQDLCRLQNDGVWDQSFFTWALEPLLRYNLVRRNQDKLAIHRAVQLRAASGHMEDIWYLWHAVLRAATCHDGGFDLYPRELESARRWVGLSDNDIRKAFSAVNSLGRPQDELRVLLVHCLGRLATTEVETNMRLAHASHLAQDIWSLQHPGTLLCQSWYASCYATQMRVTNRESRRRKKFSDSSPGSERAIRGYLETCETYSTQFGTGHLDIIRVQWRLFAVLLGQRDTEYVLSFWELCIERMKSALGTRDARTLAAQSSFAQLLLHCGKIDRGRRLRQETFLARRELFGINHPITRRDMSLSDFAGHIKDDLDRAQRHESIARQINQRLYQTRSITTQESVARLGIVFWQKGKVTFPECEATIQFVRDDGWPEDMKVDLAVAICRCGQRATLKTALFCHPHGEKILAKALKLFDQKPPAAAHEIPET